MSTTIYDIARKANVGIGTVSRVLNDHPSVADKTRQKVLAVVRRLHYKPHAYARGLARRKTKAVSIVVPSVTNYFFLEVLKGVQDRIAQSGYDLILDGVTAMDQLEKSLRRSIQRGRFDGILFFPMNLPATFSEKFLEAKTALVLVDAYHPAFDSLTVDYKAGAYQATEHLLTLGHKRIGMINSNLDSAPARKRLEGYQMALSNHGLEFDKRYLRASLVQKQDEFRCEAGYASMIEMLELGQERPTASFVSSDAQAIGVLNALRDQGLRVPDDMAIVGFDDNELTRHLGLTTICQPSYAMGGFAVEKLLERIAKPDLPVSHTQFVPKLIVRGSCGPAAHRLVSTNQVKDGNFDVSRNETV